ncbi:MAG: glutamate--tRNA ligase [Brumimicrobium sp.]
MSDKPVRVRFAPSPTGPLHIGGVRTALYNYLFAKKNNGTFILRIEDTDQTRFVDTAEDYLIESLKWCKIIPNEGQGIGGEYGPYKQSERKEIYSSYVEKLVQTGKAYYAFDTAEELQQKRDEAEKSKNHSWQYNAETRLSMTNSFTLTEEAVNQKIKNGEPYVIRFKMPKNKDIHFTDLIRGEVTINTHNLDDKVLYKSDGLPTYHMANVIDDYTMKISHVIRGEEWLSSTPLHVLLYNAFQWEAPQFAHLPLILKPNGKGKLSKRDGDKLGFPVFPMNWLTKEGEVFPGYKEEGYFPEAFINMLAFLGWNPGTTQEIFSLDELVESFTLERVSKGGARFDIDKTKWFQQHYLRTTSNKQLAQLLRNELPTELESFSDKYIETVCSIMKERATFVKDLYFDAMFLYKNPNNFDAQILKKRWKDNTNDLIKDWINILENINDFSAENIDFSFHQFIEEKQVGMGQVLLPFRLLLTGSGQGPNMFEVSELLGKEETLKRMKENLQTIIKMQEK